MSRLVVDRLWPMLLGLAALLAGALALQGWAGRRGNEAVRIVIRDESTAGDEDEDGGTGSDDLAADGAVLSELHERARLAARRAQFKEAIKLYAEALAKSPRSPALQGELGHWLMVSGDAKKALPYLERADKLRPSVRSALRLGRAREKLGDRAGAERDLRRALALRPSHRATRIALGNLLRKKGENAEAISLLEAATGAGSNEERARALVALGAAYLEAGRRADAEKVFERAVQYAPARAEVRLSIARAWLATDGKENVERARQIIQRTAALAPDVPAVYAALGHARERAGDAAGALEAYDQALRLEPRHRYARRRIVHLAIQARDFQRARHEADRLVADAPDVPEHRFLVALVADKEGRRAEARKGYLDAIAAARGDYPEAYLGLGGLERASGNGAKARAALEKAVALKPDYDVAWTSLGKLHESEGRRSAAEAAYRRALEADPGHAPAWLALGQLHLASGPVDDAIRELKKALEARPGYDAAELALGLAYAKAGRLDEAVETYRALLAEAPRHVTAWYDLALALEAKGLGAEAREALRNALAVDPGHQDSLRELASLELHERRLAEARKRFEELLDLAPGDVGARAALAELAALEGNRLGCEEAARKLRGEAPADPRVRALGVRCGVVAARAGNP